jgi:hypothetical protein
MVAEVKFNQQRAAAAAAWTQVARAGPLKKPGREEIFGVVASHAHRHRLLCPPRPASRAPRDPPAQPLHARAPEFTEGRDKSFCNQAAFRQPTEMRTRLLLFRSSVEEVAQEQLLDVGG